jgi:hypothetical protein
LSEACIDLADLDDLFEGGADEVGQALPRIFPEGPKSRMGLPSLRQPRIFSGAGAQEGVEIEVEAERRGLFHRRRPCRTERVTG